MKFIPSQINVKSNKTVWVVDDFYKDPHAVREFALKQKFSANPEYHKGIRTDCLLYTSPSPRDLG